MTPNRPAPETAKPSFRGNIGWVLSLFLIGIGVRFMMVLHSDSPLPYLDQWKAELADTYLPYFHRTLSFMGFFKAHNEHRIVCTRIYDLALLLLNGQWDSELQMTLNAVIYSAALAGFGWLLARLLGQENWPFIWLPLALVLVLPYAWENMLAGFQSQFYFMIIFSVLTIWLLGSGEPWSLRWSFGVLAGVLSLFTMASGFLGAVAAAAICLLDIAKQPQLWRRHWPTLLVCGALTVAGFLLKVHVHRHDVYQAQSLHAFQVSLGKNLAWPSSYLAALVPLNLLPLILLMWLHARSREPQPFAARLTLALGAWGALQAAASAYARGQTGNEPAWRYMDPESFIMIANVLSIILLVRHYGQQLAWKPFWYTAFALWGVLCISGLCVLTNAAVREAIPAWQDRQNNRIANTRVFMATDDPHVFDRKLPGDLPYPDKPQLVLWLRDPDIRRILPACVFDGTKEPRELAPLSLWSRRMLRTWKFCLIAGAACLLWSLATFVRSKRPEATSS